MHKGNKHLRDLIRRYFDNQLAPGEFDALWKYLSEFNSASGSLHDELRQLWEETSPEQAGLPDDRWERGLSALLEPGNACRHPMPAAGGAGRGAGRRTWRLAATVLLLVGAGLSLVYYREYRSGKLFHVAVSQHQIVPGGNKAFLTLSSGRKIFLDSFSAGVIQGQSGARILNLNHGQLAYYTPKGASGEMSYNVLTTPRGGQYQVVLSDGTKVWINAASSLRYPVAFQDDTRVVELDGEAYFEVAKDASRPFEVRVGRMQVQVLGTSFNIKAYPGEKVAKTTLVSGAVRVKEDEAEVSLKPGQEARVYKKGAISLIPDADVDAAIAWKNSLFWFDNESIESIMGKISRWYDVDVEIKGDFSRHFTGSLPRSAAVSRVFRLLEETGAVHFEVENRKIIVTP
jgi:ferric-dicitrate binding protein FerR (iron transport regulator)